ncbi:MAG: response regulator [Methanobacteriota archaeon]
MKNKIMLVDDNPDLTYLVKKRLERLEGGYEIFVAKNADECFQLLSKGQIPDIILLDIMMPGMNGWDVLATLRNNLSWKNIPVVFMTAKTDDVSKGLGSLTSDGYITKPFDITEIKAMIERILGGKTQ